MVTCDPPLPNPERRRYGRGIVVLEVSTTKLNGPVLNGPVPDRDIQALSYHFSARVCWVLSFGRLEASGKPNRYRK